VEIVKLALAVAIVIRLKVPCYEEKKEGTQRGRTGTTFAWGDHQNSSYVDHSVEVEVPPCPGTGRVVLKATVTQKQANKAKAIQIAYTGNGGLFQRLMWRAPKMCPSSCTATWLLDDGKERSAYYDSVGKTPRRELFPSVGLPGWQVGRPADDGGRGDGEAPDPTTENSEIDASGITWRFEWVLKYKCVPPVDRTELPRAPREFTPTDGGVPSWGPTPGAGGGEEPREPSRSGGDDLSVRAESLARDADLVARLLFSDPDGIMASD
jgi:hypothetical protein